MRIPCPYCGLRDSHEFVCRGEAAGVRPEGDDPTAFAAHLYLRGNPAGEVAEHWYHARGCRNWLVVRRDTRTHAIAAAALARDVRA